MDVAGASTTHFVSRHHEHPPATLEELLRVSAKRASIVNADVTRERMVERRSDGDDAESDSDYQYGDDGEINDDLEDSEPEVDERRLHATEPREDLYLHEMRRQRGRMDEKEAQWVRGYIKAQRAWKARTGHSIDEFLIPGSTVCRVKKSRSTKRNRPRESLAREQEEEENEEASASLCGVVTRLEALLLLAAIMFVCLSLGVQLYVAVTAEHEPLDE
ncbi:hypothetical protein PHYPSEUDO_003494 [Phytophthora pseudosyringae]|uniref:Transmembrane protein n=1 Tax=Phytophthora pseudosyringae TaxID=221518 RepID=A0A8T1VUB6_9STRA|nr:hypothetical protein PHYPSEUDO_003494 [Phytophthora pseudosyringae]